MVFGQKSSTPVDKVMQMQSQGISNDQIINTLQREGFKSSEIFDALTQADVKKTITQASPSGMPSPANPIRDSPSGVSGSPPSPPMPGSNDRTSVDRIEEIAEAIIDEKWDQLVESVNKIIDWKEKTDQELASLKTKVEQVSANFQQVQKSIMSRVDEYDRTMTEVGTDVKALTKVFQKILPGFVENVSELSRITDKLKGGSGKTESEVIARPRSKSRSQEIFEEDSSIEDIE